MSRLAEGLATGREMGRAKPVRLAIELTIALRRTESIQARTLRRSARLALAAEGFRSGLLSIAVVGAARMSRLHEIHTGIAGPTDVLTFDLGSDRQRGWIDGEIIVCADVARRCCPAPRRRAATRPPRRSSAARRRALTAELCLYVVHGILHLAGYDDHTPAAYRRMHAREDALLTRAGLGAVFTRGQPA